MLMGVFHAIELSVGFVSPLLIRPMIDNLDKSSISVGLMPLWVILGLGFRVFGLLSLCMGDIGIPFPSGGSFVLCPYSSDPSLWSL